MNSVLVTVRFLGLYYEYMTNILKLICLRF